MLAEYPEEPFRICDDASEQQRIDVLQDIAVKSSNNPYVLALAHTVRNEAGRNASEDRLTQEALLAIQCLEYHQHPDGEWFQGVGWTLKHGGNCEDLSTALVSLLLALGIPARVAWIDQYDMPLNHVVVRLENGLWADPSIWGARLGEDSYTAIDRVQIEGVTHPADLAFRASKEYPMFKRSVKMKRPAGLSLDPGRFGGLGLRVNPAPGASGPVLAILAPVADSVGASPPAISGTAPANTLVKITDSVGTAIGQTMSGADGNWSLPLPVYPPTTYALNASTPDGSSIQVRFTVQAASTTGAATALAITSPANGSGFASSPGSAMGTAAPGSTVAISLNGTYVGSVIADASGNWSIALPSGSTGSNSIKASSGSNTAQVSYTVALPGSPGPLPGTGTTPVASNNTMWWLLGAAAVGLLIWSGSKEEHHAE